MPGHREGGIYFADKTMDPCAAAALAGCLPGAAVLLLAQLEHQPARFRYGRRSRSWPTSSRRKAASSARTGTIPPELRVVNTQLVMAPLFRLFSSWHTVRVLGSVILFLILLAAYPLFCAADAAAAGRACRGRGALPAVLRALSAICTAGALLYPAPGVQLWLVRLPACGLPRPKRPALAWGAGYALLGLLAALGGPRQLFVLQGPLTFAVLALGWAETPRGVPLANRARALLGGAWGWRLALCLAGDLAGLAVMRSMQSGLPQTISSRGRITSPSDRLILTGWPRSSTRCWLLSGGEKGRFSRQPHCSTWLLSSGLASAWFGLFALRAAGLPFRCRTGCSGRFTCRALLFCFSLRFYQQRNVGPRCPAPDRLCGAAG